MAEIAFIQPCLWFDDRAREAMEYYVDVFPNSRINRIDEYPDASLDEHFAGMSGKVINGQFTLNGVDFVCLDGGPLFTFNESISFVVSCVDQAEIDRYWEKLSHVPESEQCGWCKDRFGVSWQIIPANLSDLMSRPGQIQAMMRQKKIVIAELESACRVHTSRRRFRLVVSRGRTRDTCPWLLCVDVATRRGEAPGVN